MPLDLRARRDAVVRALQAEEAALTGTIRVAPAAASAVGAEDGREMRLRLTALERRLHVRLDDLGSQLDGFVTRLGETDARVDDVGIRVGETSTRVDDVVTRVDVLESAVDKLLQERPGAARPRAATRRPRVPPVAVAPASAVLDAVLGPTDSAGPTGAP